MQQELSDLSPKRCAVGKFVSSLLSTLLMMSEFCSQEDIVTVM